MPDYNTKMYANYHAHTRRCGHAVGTEREYVERAIEGGYRIFGFSDHTPQIYESDYYPVNQKMRPEQLEDYVTTILQLRDEYKNDIDIRLGLEVEYFPKTFEKLLHLIGQYPIEYIILGQHCIGDGGPDDFFMFAPTDSGDILKKYVSQCIEGLETGRFLYFAHPDVIHFTGDEELYRSEMRKLCIRAKELHIPLEFNLLGLRGGRNYPNPLFWQLVSETGNDVILGSDAHTPGDVWRPEIIQRAEEITSELGLNVLQVL